METAIRWAPHPAAPDRHRFVLVDVAGNSISLNECGTQTSGGHLITRTLARYEKTPNFNAFDWSKHDPSLIALGLASGDASLIKIANDEKTIEPLRIFPIKTQRKCNSINFSKSGLLAVGLDRVRNDHCLTIHDVNGAKEPLTRLCTGEAVSSVRFFPGHPSELIAAVSRTTLRLYDLRAPASSSVNTPGQANVFTKQVNNIAIDPVDDNYFTSAGFAGDPCVSVWDKRWLARSTDTHSSTQALLDIRPAVDNPSSNTAIWSVRFSGLKRGRVCVLSSEHELKLYDIATHSAGPVVKLKSTSQSTIPSVYGGFPWSSATYVSKTHRLKNPLRENPAADAVAAESNTEPVVVEPALAFDWITAGDASAQTMLAVMPSREIALLHAPRVNYARITPRGDLSLIRPQGSLELLEPSIGPRHDPPIDDLTIQHSKAPSLLSVKTKIFDAVSQAQHRPSTSTAKRTDEWLNGPGPPNNHVSDVKTVGEVLYDNNIHSQRCRNGYRLDATANLVVVQDDQTLLKLWLIVRRFDHLCKTVGMVTDTLDLSYLGVYALWNGMEKETRNRILDNQHMSPALFAKATSDLVDSHGLPRAVMMPSPSLNRRLLCLEMCGWCFSREALENKCSDLLNQQLYYRAVAIAVWQGHDDLALLVLRNMARTKVMPDTGLGALLAAKELNRDQWDMAEWMQEEASDPYLKSLLVHVRQRDWHAVVQNTTLNLSDRVSVAIRYFDDDELSKFIGEVTAECIKAGDVNGLLMTGLDSTSMDLLQNYITQTDDIQTAVLVAALANPLYVDDVRWDMWKEAYLWHMQVWGTFVERTKFLVEHSRRSVTPSGERLVKPMPRQITLRCVHCNGSLAERHSEATTTNTATTTIKYGEKKVPTSETVCPRCSRHLPRCVICMRWLGTPEVGPFSSLDDAPPGQLPKAEKTGSKSGINDKDLLSRFVTFCANCGHGFHAHHAIQWFAKHGMCPVPDCQCLCGLRA